MTDENQTEVDTTLRRRERILRMECLKLAAEGLRGSSAGAIVRAASAMEAYISSGTVPPKPEGSNASH